MIVTKDKKENLSNAYFVSEDFYLNLFLTVKY